MHRRTMLGSRVSPYVAVMPLACLAGCNSIMNAWLDPTVLGNFTRTATMEIRTSLTLEDTPPGIPGAVYPSPEDLLIRPVEYPISPGDTLTIEIYELRQRLLPYQAQVLVSSTGYVNLPVVGRVDAAGLTVPEFEDALKSALQEQDILREPDLSVNPLFLQNATYSIFGIGVSAANNAPLRAGTFPIRRPDLRVLEAINQVGGLNEFVTDVYVFRSDTPPWAAQREAPLVPGAIPTTEPAGGAEYDAPGAEGSRPSEENEQTDTTAPEEDLIDAVIGGDDAGQQEEESPPSDELPKLLEPDPTQPYIWINNEFVPNPVYQTPTRDAASLPQGPPVFDTTAPAVNWARIAGDTSYRVIRIPAEQLRSGDPEVNIIIRAADVIRIISGEIGVYYVMGQVNRVGAFRFNAEAITLKAAIAVAGGLSDLAWPDRCTVYRRLGQREQMIQVDLDRVFAGKDPDFYIKRGDIINVGTHPFAPFLQRIRALTLPNPVSNVGYSYTYVRNFADIDSFAARRNPHNEPDLLPALFP
ncbi:MAG: polysaccharide biosynthesis/export family protein [Phycisphaerales bacterium]|nr:MAG: polysaccharide biosynthesis/export family protein [Phycisphaerales bacterium]